MSEAVCKGKTSLFYMSHKETVKQRRTRESAAKVICNQCPVMHKCRSHARKANELGIWGGETEEERYYSGNLDNPVTNRYFARRDRIERNKLSN
jgi:WhiB family redox-sensing transcriptional regulator